MKALLRLAVLLTLLFAGVIILVLFVAKSNDVPTLKNDDFESDYFPGRILKDSSNCSAIPMASSILTSYVCFVEKINSESYHFSIVTNSELEIQSLSVFSRKLLLKDIIAWYGFPDGMVRTKYYKFLFWCKETYRIVAYPVTIRPTTRVQFVKIESYNLMNSAFSCV